MDGTTLLTSITALLTALRIRRSLGGLLRLAALTALAAAALFIQDAATAFIALAAAFYVTIGVGRYIVTLRPQSHYPVEERAARRRDVQLMRFRAVLCVTSALCLVGYALIHTRGARAWTYIDWAVVVGTLAITAVAELAALISHHRVAPRLVEALSLRTATQAALQRSPALRGTLDNSDGVLQPPLIVVVALYLATAASFASFGIAAGVRQVTVSDIAERIAPPTKPTAEPMGSPSPTASPTPSAALVSAAPDVRSAEEWCGKHYTKTISSNAPADIADALVTAFNRASPRALGCPLRRSYKRGAVWVLETGERGRPSGLVIADRGGRANAVLGRRVKDVLGLLDQSPPLRRVTQVVDTGLGDYQVYEFADGTCGLSIRRLFADAPTYVEPPAARVIVDLSLLRWGFPYITNRSERQHEIVYSVRFEYSDAAAVEVRYDRRTRRVSNASALRLADQRTCPNRDAFAGLAAVLRERNQKSLRATTRP